MKMFLLVLLVSATSVFSSEISLKEVKLTKELSRYNTYEIKYQINQETGDVFVRFFLEYDEHYCQVVLPVATAKLAIQRLLS